MLFFSLLFCAVATSGLGLADASDDFLLVWGDASGQQHWDARANDSAELPECSERTLRQLRLRYFNGAEAVPRFALSSPVAQWNEERAIFSGDEFIHVAGQCFTVVGGHWQFCGIGGNLLLSDGVQVFLDVDMAQSFADENWRDFAEEEEFTTISADNLKISRCDGGLRLHFFGCVRAQTNNFTLSCQELSVGILFQFTPGVSERGQDGEELIRHIAARGEICVIVGEKSIFADEMELFPGENAALFVGAMYLFGGEVHRGEQHIFFRDGQCHAIWDGIDEMLSECSCGDFSQNAEGGH
ncbi:MAG: hypothetical protein LBC42_01495 [Puniceicoccales bacterium]|jgi:hypothetical protein|nr:hypothetical protein [Puniceicoccales bacterium]